MSINKKTIFDEQWMIDLLEKASDNAFETMVEQMRINPDAIEALYG